MLDALQKKNLKVRILLGIVLGLISVGMLVYLIPGQGSSNVSSADVVAEVGGQQVTTLEVRQQLQRIARRGSIPRSLEPLYAQQIVNQLVYERMIELEAKRLGIRVTDAERAERIRQLLPSALTGGNFVGMEQYATEVQLRFDMGVAEFEELIRQGLLEEKFRRLVTDGISVTPEEVQQEFRRRNEKVKIEYALIKPDELESKVAAGDAELASYFAKNKARYVVPERRVVRFALLDLNQLRQRISVSDEELRAYYNEHIEVYRIQNRVRVSHILFKTIGKTDAEVEEIRKKAEEVLRKARHGSKFEDLAKQYSDDTTKDKGGDLGWIVQGQTVPEFEKAAFTLPPGSISDLVRTQYGFHIVKVMEHQAARTQSFEEVRGSILPLLAGEKADRQSGDLADQIAAAVRRSNRQPLDDIAKQFKMTLGETRPMSATDPVPELGTSPEVREAIFRLREGELSSPIRTDRGYIVLTVKEVQRAHPGGLAEVREKVAADFRRERAGELARTQAEELAKRGQSGESLATAAKALGFELKTSDAFPRTGSVPGAGSARQFPSAFTLAVGQTAPPVSLGANWMVFGVVVREEAKPEEFEKQRKDLEQQVLQSKRGLAYEAFRSALEDRMKREGKLKIMQDNLRRLGSSS
jgi:peptidyl-prolyl cis-trans isomerase D